MGIFSKGLTRGCAHGYYLQIEGVVGHLRVGVQHVAKAAVVAREEHHEPELYHEARYGDDGQQVLFVPVHRDVVDVDLGTVTI